jgi:hypothetical protein
MMNSDTKTEKQPVDEARAADIDSGTFDDSTYHMLSRFLPHEKIMDALKPSSGAHGVGIPVEYLYTALANNRGNYEYALDEARSYLDRDKIIAQASRNARNAPTLARAMSENLLTQPEHDNICESLKAHHSVLGGRSSDLPDSVGLFSRMVPGEHPEELVDRVQGWNDKKYSRAHEWMGSQIDKLKSGSVITPMITTSYSKTPILNVHDVFNHIHRAIHGDQQLAINYMGANDLEPRGRAIVPTHAWFDPVSGRAYVRAYDKTAQDDPEGSPEKFGAWRTFRADKITGMSPTYKRAIETGPDAEAPAMDAKLRSISFNNGITSLDKPDTREPSCTCGAEGGYHRMGCQIKSGFVGSGSHCSCGSTDGLHTVECYQDMASKLIKHYTAQMVSSCINPVPGEDVDTISPETLSSFISTRRKLGIATQAASSAFFPEDYSEQRHG